MKELSGWACLVIAHIYVVSGEGVLDIAFAGAWIIMSFINFSRAWK